MNKKSPCLREYIQSMWPALWMSGVMAVPVLFLAMIFKYRPEMFVLITQILCGAAVYFGLMLYSQRTLVSEIRDMLWNKSRSIEIKNA